MVEGKKAGVVVWLGSVVEGLMSSPPGRTAAAGMAPSSPKVGAAVVVKTLSDESGSTKLFLMSTAMHLPVRSSNLMMSLMSATTMPANRMAPMNLT